LLSLMKFPLHTRIFIGMVVGATLGLVTQFAGTPPETVDAIIKWVKPVGDIFLRMIFMMVIPLILSGLMLGIADLGDLKKVGRIGLITLMFSVVVTTISVFIGIGLTALVRPGDGLNAAERTVLVERFGETTQTVAGNMNAVREKSIGEIIVSLVPRNPLEDMVNAFNPNYTGGGLLAVMFFAVIAGIALSRADKERTSTFKRMLEGLYDLVMEAIKMAMQLAPFGVAALLYTMTAKMGWGIFIVLSKYVLVVVAALAIHQFGTYSLLLKFIGGMNPGFFFRNIREAMLTAFSTSSSNATLPTAIRVAQNNLKLPRDVSNFVLTVGSTANQNGTALYEGVTVLFLAQVFGVQLELSQQIFVVLICILAGVGTAGVPGGSLPVIMVILVSVGIPAEGIAIIYGVDRFLDMCRTTTNVTGDIVASVVASRFAEPEPAEAPLQ